MFDLKNKKVWFLASIILSIMVAGFVEKFVYPTTSFMLIRFIFVFVVFLLFLIFFLFIKKKELYFIFDNRYKLGMIVFLILIIFGFHGSSISIYNQAIQGNNNVIGSNPIFGTSRTIRGDEWAVSTPTLLSQSKNQYNVKSKILNAYNANVTLYPKIIAKGITALSIPNQIPFLIFPLNQAFSFYWYFGYFLLFFGAIEFFLIITKGDKIYSIVGSILITFSPLVQWFEAWNIIAYGMWAIVVIYKYIKTDSVIKKILLAVLLGILGSCYIMTLYPAWLVPYTYFFVIVFVWIIVDNYKDVHIKSIALLILISIFVMALIIIPSIKDSYDIYNLISHTAYPGKRFMLGGYGWEKLFGYFTCIYNSIKESANPCEMSQFISLYPIPIFMGIYYSLKNRLNIKEHFLLIALSIYVILLSIWNFIKLPRFISKITLLYMSTPERSVVVVGFVSIVLLILCLSNYHSSTTSTKRRHLVKCIIISILVVFIGIYANKRMYPDYFSLKMILFDLLFFIPVIVLIIINNKKMNKYAIIMLSFLTMFTGVLVHPLNRTIDVIYKKPVAKKIQQIEKKHPNAIWIMDGNEYYISNYMVANGADTINSTNFYPIISFWKKIGLIKKDEIYNRYAHLLVNITNKKTSVKLNYMDQIKLNLNSHKLCKLNVKYVLSTNSKLDKLNDNYINIKQVYNDDGIYIYLVKCSND